MLPDVWNDTSQKSGFQTIRKLFIELIPLYIFFSHIFIILFHIEYSEGFARKMTKLFVQLSLIGGKKRFVFVAKEAKMLVLLAFIRLALNCLLWLF
jgi:hypothetical protein